MDPLAVVVTGLWAMLPAYVPNNAAVLAGGGAPIDGGRSLDGRRLLGDGKTWRGTVGGILAGALLSSGLNAIRPTLEPILDITLPAFPLGPTLALPVGAMVGDIIASFGKRRLDKERGAAVPVIDQLDFVMGALALVFVVDPGWTAGVFSLPVLGVVVLMTPILHLSTNWAAYVVGLKNEPW